MLILRKSASCPDSLRHAVIALGNFDGVHLAHRAVIEQSRHIATSLRAPLAVMTFEPHPRRYFQPQARPLRIYPFRTKAMLLKELGVEGLFALRFDAALANLSAEAFITELLVKELGAHHLVTGHNFVFGKGRGGDTTMLSRYAASEGFGYTMVQAQQDKTGQEISSTRIRTALEQGQINEASRLLGRPYTIRGHVRHGDQRGRMLGFPTANLWMARLFTPAYGVYVVHVQLQGETQWRPGIANIGMRPTFSGSQPLLEVHLFDYAGDLYGSLMTVRPMHFLRPEQRFNGPAELIAQIRADCLEARQWLTAQEAHTA